MRERKQERGIRRLIGMKVRIEKEWDGSKVMARKRSRPIVGWG